MGAAAAGRNGEDYLRGPTYAAGGAVRLGPIESFIGLSR